MTASPIQAFLLFAQIPFAASYLAPCARSFLPKQVLQGEEEPSS